MKCGRGMSRFFSVNTRVRLSSRSIQHLYWISNRTVNQSHCEESLINNRITDLLADDILILAEALEVLVLALKPLHMEVKPLRLKDSWAKIKVQVFGGLLNEMVLCSSMWQGF